MNDLISKQAAIDVLEERLHANGYSNVGLTSELNRSIGDIMRLPSVESEIVRCKDCKYRSEGSTMFTMVTATSWCNKMAIPRLDEDSCGKGKRAKE